MYNKTLVTNSLIAAIYVAVSFLIQPIAFSNIQFRIPEMFNHLVVFSKKYFFGIVIGVFITNLFSPLGIYDLTFGLGHSVISLSIIILISRYIKNKWTLMILNTLVFTFNMFIIAWELYLVFDLPFFLTWATTAAGECLVMAVGIPIMKALDARIDFNKLMGSSSTTHRSA